MACKRSGVQVPYPPLQATFGWLFLRLPDRGDDALPTATAVLHATK